MSRIILHSDMNCFYASVEMLHHLELAGKPMAVGGDPEARHGIVLTANYIAKRAGVKTGMALWQARQVCPEIIFVPPRMDLYLRFSRMAQEIYSEYTDQREPFGIDESWLDDMPSTTYYRNRKKAIRLYATMLWAFTRPKKIQNKMEEIDWKKSGRKVAVN